MIYPERACRCGCGRTFMPRRCDQRYLNAHHRAAHWHDTHPAGVLSERFLVAVGSDATYDSRETFTGPS